MKQVGLCFLCKVFLHPKDHQTTGHLGNHNFLLAEDCKTDLRPKEDWPRAKRSWPLGLQLVFCGINQARLITMGGKLVPSRRGIDVSQCLCITLKCRKLLNELNLQG